MEQSVLTLLKEHGFAVHRSSVGVQVQSAGGAGDNVVLLIELMSGALPPLMKHNGPPVYMREHAERFKMKFEDEETFSGVYIENGRYVVDTYRKYASAKHLLESKLLSCALGKQMYECASLGYTVLEDEEVVYTVDFEFLSRFFR